MSNLKKEIVSNDIISFKRELNDRFNKLKFMFKFRDVMRETSCYYLPESMNYESSDKLFDEITEDIAEEISEIDIYEKKCYIMNAINHTMCEKNIKRVQTYCDSIEKDYSNISHDDINKIIFKDILNHDEIKELHHLKNHLNKKIDSTQDFYYENVSKKDLKLKYDILINYK